MATNRMLDLGRMRTALALALVGACAAATAGCIDSDDDLTTSSGTGGATGAAVTGSNANGFGSQAGNGTTGTAGECAGVSQEAMPMARPADIIVAIDTSGSMNEEIVFVQDHLNDLSNIISNSGVDAHVVLIAEEDVCIPAPLGSGQCGGQDTNLPGYYHLNQGVGSTNALQLFIETYDDWVLHTRPDAAKIFVVITDDDSNMSASEFTMELVALDPTYAEFKLDGIFCLDDCPDAASIGTVYSELVAQTMGVAGDLCLQDFGPVFMDIAENVVATSGIACDFAIPPPPSGQTFARDQVNVDHVDSGGVRTSFPYVEGGEDACPATGGWYYDDVDMPTRIFLCPASCETVKMDLTGKIEVLFGCATNGPS